MSTGPPHGNTHIVPPVAVRELRRLGVLSAGDEAQAKALIESHQGGEISDETYAELKAPSSWPPSALLP